MVYLLKSQPIWPVVESNFDDNWYFPNNLTLSMLSSAYFPSFFGEMSVKSVCPFSNLYCFLPIEV